MSIKCIIHEIFHSRKNYSKKIKKRFIFYSSRSVNLNNISLLCSSVPQIMLLNDRLINFCFHLRKENYKKKNSISLNTQNAYGGNENELIVEKFVRDQEPNH